MRSNAEGYLAGYGEYAKVLRTWFATYGIGAPVILFTNDGLARAVKASGEIKLIVGCLLAGLGIQVILAAANKASMWAMYYGETQESFKNRRRYKVSHWISEAFWIDFLVDVGTMLLFALATWRMLDILLK